MKTEVFDGPIDLLLALAMRREVDLNLVSLAELTADYLAAIQSDLGGTAARDPEEMAAFLVVGSRLLALKAASLLPGDDDQEEEEEDLEAWEAEVRQRMLEYQRFKEAADELMRRHVEGGFSFTSAIEAQIVPTERVAIDPGGLASAFQAVLDRLPPPDEVQVRLRNYSLADEMTGLRRRLAETTRTSFSTLFDRAESRLHAVVIFLAL
ncbi:MAG: segregation and condensation protein A, partial [Candidatus Dormibacteria bacterium]